MTDAGRPIPNPTAASLLGFLHEGPMTGWDLVATAQRRIGDFWSLTRSQVYRELATMSEAGLVRAGDRGRRDRRPYTITAAGRRAFRDWMELGPGDETIRFPLLLSVLFGAYLPPKKLHTIIREHRDVHAARLAAYEAANSPAARGERSVYQQATLDFGIGYERAALAWFDALPARIRGPAAPDAGRVAGRR